MKEYKPELIIVAGANGTGKSTSTSEHIVKGIKVIDPDAIAKKLNPINPRSVDFKAGKKAVVQANEYLKNKTSFIIETTLAGKYHFNLIKKAKAQGYKTSLVFIATKNPGLNIERIKLRVKDGGHHIDDDVVKRRYKRGMDNLGKTFDQVDKKVLIDNSDKKPRTILIVDKKALITKSLPKWSINALGKDRIKSIVVKSIKQVNQNKDKDIER